MQQEEEEEEVQFQEYEHLTEQPKDSQIANLSPSLVSSTQPRTEQFVALYNSLKENIKLTPTPSSTTNRAPLYSNSVKLNRNISRRRHATETQILSLQDTSLLFTSQVIDHNEQQCLYQIHARSAKLCDEALPTVIYESSSEYSFNARRGLLAGRSNYAKGVSYELWEPLSKGLESIRRTKWFSSPNKALRIGTNSILNPGESNNPNPLLNPHFNIDSLDFSPDGDRIATASVNHILRVSSVDTNVLLSSVVVPVNDSTHWRSSVCCRWMGQDDKILVNIRERTHSLYLVDPETKKIVDRSNQRSFELRGFDLSRTDSNLIAASLCQDGRVVIFDARISLFFPIKYLKQGSRRGHNPLKFKITEKPALPYIWTPFVPFKWNPITANELLGWSYTSIGIFDLRNDQFSKICNSSWHTDCTFV